MSKQNKLDFDPWQPIASAPTDGTRFVARRGGVELLTQWGKTSHVPLYGWCYILSDYGDPDYDLWSPAPEEWRPELSEEVIRHSRARDWRRG